MNSNRSAPVAAAEEEGVLAVVAVAEATVVTAPVEAEATAAPWEH